MIGQWAWYGGVANHGLANEVTRGRGLNPEVEARGAWPGRGGKGEAPVLGRSPKKTQIYPKNPPQNAKIRPKNHQDRIQEPRKPLRTNRGGENPPKSPQKFLRDPENSLGKPKICPKISSRTLKTPPGFLKSLKIGL